MSVSDASPEVEGLLRYRLLTGTDDRAFCEKISAALAAGYVLHGSPAITYDGARPVVAQAVVLPQHATSPGTDPGTDLGTEPGQHPGGHPEGTSETAA